MSNIVEVTPSLPRQVVASPLHVKAEGASTRASLVVAVTAGVVAGNLLGSTAGTSPLIRNTLSQQLAQCAAIDGSDGGSAVAATISGSGSANLLQMRVGSDVSSRGYGYRGSLVSALVVVGGSAGLLAVAAVVAHSCCGRRFGRTASPRIWSRWKDMAMSAGEPGWWLAGPYAVAVAPMLSAAVSLASVTSSSWGGSVDGALVVLSLLLGCTFVAWCAKALLRPSSGGWFTATCQKPAQPLRVRSRGILAWWLAGASCWVADPHTRSRHNKHGNYRAHQHFIHAYGALFTGMRPQRHWWFLVDLAASVTVGLLAALPALFVHRDDAAEVVPRVCTGALHASTAVQVVFLSAHVVLSPVAVRWERALSTLLASIGAVSALLVSLQDAGVDGVAAASSVLDTAQLAITVVVLVLGLLEEAIALLTSQLPRRMRRMESVHPTTSNSEREWEW